MEVCNPLRNFEVLFTAAPERMLESEHECYKKPNFTVTCTSCLYIHALKITLTKTIL